MNKRYLLLCFPALLTFMAKGQSAIEAINFTQQDLNGTARFMSMGGAFGALGGDLSSISVNPAGIGVYRSNDIGITMGLDCQSATSNSDGFKEKTNLTKFQLKNAGGVFTIRLNNSTIPNLNFGFTYNKDVSFNRHVRGYFPNLRNSLSNYIAGVTNYGPSEGQSWTEADLHDTDSFNAWNPGDGGEAAPWMSILGYEGFLITPIGNKNNPNWVGQFGSGTSGAGMYEFKETGSVDSYNISLGGNIANTVFWGMDFDIVNFNYGISNYWGESLKDAYVEADGGYLEKIKANWSLNNAYQASGTGFNYKLGVIVKPIQELRFGFAFHTPTWYSLSETYTGKLNYQYGSQNPGWVSYNRGNPATVDMNFRTPWRLVASVAGVIGGRFIISADYEWANYKSMRFSTPSYNGWDYDGGYDYDYPFDNWWDYPYYANTNQTKSGQYITSYDTYKTTNQDIHKYCQKTNTFRLGAEFRISSNFSIRAGYSYISSPITEKARHGEEIIYTSDTRPSFKFNNSTNFITAGLGYKGKHFYADLAYVYKHQFSEFFAYPTDPANIKEIDTTPHSRIGFSNSRILLTMGVRF